jgi:hypothetical protein
MKLKEIAENHGLTPEGVDYALTQYQIVICEITHGMLSKLSYDAKDIIRTAQERWCDTCDLKEHEPVEPHWRCSTVYMNGTGKIEMICGNCGISIPLGKPNYCPWCGRKVKWDEAD